MSCSNRQPRRRHGPSLANEIRAHHESEQARDARNVWLVIVALSALAALAGGAIL